MLRSVLAAFAALLLAGCATDRPLETACGRLHEFETVEPDPLVPAAARALAPSVARAPDFADAFARAFVGRGQSTLAVAAPRWSDALILSGGGAWGAYGAGFIGGWSAHGRLPARVTTGISTGALQATFAFLGRDADDRLRAAYSISSERQLVIDHGSTFFLSHASVADTAPLKPYLVAHVGPLLDDVAKEARATGRGLFVGAVNARTGRFSIFDLTRMATEMKGAERLDCYTAALLASAAVPVIFRQATINGDPWLDGGVRYALFLPSMVRAVAAAKARAAADGGDARSDGMVYAIKNGTLLPERVTDAQVAPKLLPTLLRLRSIVFNGVERDSLALAAAEAQRGGLTLSYTTADGWRTNPGCRRLKVGAEDKLFDPGFMRCLIGFGQRRWATGTDPWITYPQ